MTLGEKIKKFRIEKELTQKDLAEKVHVTFQTVSKWEKDENEPDVSTIKELSKVFSCSLDDLLGDDEEPLEEEKQQPDAIVEPVQISKEPAEPTKTIVIHQKELHVCEKCKKDIPEDDLEMEQVCVKHRHRGSPAVYRQAYYHKECLEEIRKERAAAQVRAKKAHASSSSKKCFGWGIAAGSVVLIALLVILLVNSFGVGTSILISIISGYGMFAMLYCILSGSYIGEVFVWCASLSIKFPGIIFSWDLDGFAFLIAMKILFAVLGFFIGLLALGFAIGFSAFLGIFSFPFVLIHNINTDYEDAF